MIRVRVRVVVRARVAHRGAGLSHTHMPVMHAPLPCVPYGPACPCGGVAQRGEAWLGGAVTDEVVRVRVS